MSELDRDLQAFRDQTEPDAGQLARLRAGRPPRSRTPALVLGGLAVAAAALLAVGLGAGNPGSRLEAADPPVPPTETLATSFSGRQTEQLGPFVTVEADGHGAVQGTERDLELRWESGVVTVRVEPDRGVALRVSTPEGQVHVRGTVFAVDRGALGTEVSVERGTVEVRCGGGASQVLRAAGRVTCEPTTAAGWLRRVAVLQREGDWEPVLAGTSQGLAAEPSAELAIELRLHRAVALGALHRLPEARQTLDALASDHPEAADRVAATRARLEAP